MAKNKQWQEQPQQEQENITQSPQSAPESPLETQQLGGSAEAQTAPESRPAPMPASEPSPVTAPANLEALLASLTPEQLARIRQKAIGEGVVAPSSLDGIKSADGSLTLSVTLDPMATEQLEIWAEADGFSLVEEAQKRIAESLNNYLYGDWNPAPEPAPVAAPAAATAAADVGAAGTGRLST